MPFLVSDLAHHTRRGFIAVFLQPADRHILQHRITAAVRGFGTLHAVKTGHDEIKGLAFDNGVTDTELEILITRPQVQRFVADIKIEVNLVAFVLVGRQLREVLRLTLGATGGVGGAGDGAGDADANFFPFHFADRHNVDAGQKVRGLLHGVHQGLGDRRFNGEFFRHITGVDAVQFGNTGQVSIKFKAGFLAHSFS